MLHLWRNARWQQTFVSAYTKVSGMLGGRLLVRQVLHYGQWFANGKSARNCCRNNTMPCSAHVLLLPNCLWCFTFLVSYSWIVSSFVLFLFCFFRSFPVFGVFLQFQALTPTLAFPSFPFRFELPFISSLLHSPSLAPFYLFSWQSYWRVLSIDEACNTFDEKSHKWNKHEFSGAIARWRVTHFSFWWYLSKRLL